MLQREFQRFEGIIETDTWFGPLFTNLRLTRSNSPVEFHRRRPLFQVQPLWRQSYTEPGFKVLEAANLDDEDWQRFATTIEPNTVQMRRLGHYAVDTRKRLRSNSPSRASARDLKKTAHAGEANE